MPWSHCTLFVLFVTHSNWSVWKINPFFVFLQGLHVIYFPFVLMWLNNLKTIQSNWTLYELLFYSVKTKILQCKHCSEPCCLKNAEPHQRPTVPLLLFFFCHIWHMWFKIFSYFEHKFYGRAPLCYYPAFCLWNQASLGGSKFDSCNMYFGDIFFMNVFINFENCQMHNIKLFGLAAWNSDA